MLTKACLRQRLVAQRSALMAAEVCQKSAAIATYVHATPAFAASHVIMVYLALPQEVQTALIMSAAFQQQKRVVVPVIRHQEMLAVELSSSQAVLRRGLYGLLEPCDISRVVHPGNIGCVYVPGVAFDRRGGRLGFGKGYYDRFLRHVSATTEICGLAFSLQIVSCVPQMCHDIRVHVVVTEQGLIPCERVLRAGQNVP